MKTGSLSARVTLAILAVLVLVLAVMVAAVTAGYRSSLDRDLRSQLRAAAAQFSYAPSDDSTKVLIFRLARQGIAVHLEPPAREVPGGKGGTGRPAAPGSRGMIRTRGSLVVLRQVLLDGTRLWLAASTSGARQAARRLLAIEIAVALAALAVTALLMRRVTGAALRPLTHVSQTANLIASGQTTRRLQPTRPDTDLGSMAAAFDQMVDGLAAAVSGARHAEETMRRFLADASHELRTPITALQASAETLLREQPRRPRRDAIEANLARDTARLGRLVDDLLSLARLEAPQPAHSEPTELGLLAQTEISRQEHHAGSTGISLARDRPAQVIGDPDALSRLIRNLLDNAVAASSAGHVHVRVTADGDHARLIIADDGPGVPAADRERIFDRFVRLAPCQRPGTGLGLAIARRIARQHNGQLTCDPAERGAHFTITLPRAIAGVPCLLLGEDSSDGPSHAAGSAGRSGR